MMYCSEQLCLKKSSPKKTKTVKGRVIGTEQMVLDAKSGGGIYAYNRAPGMCHFQSRMGALLGAVFSLIHEIKMVQPPTSSGAPWPIIRLACFTTMWPFPKVVAERAHGFEGTFLLR